MSGERVHEATVTSGDLAGNRDSIGDDPLPAKLGECVGGKYRLLKVLGAGGMGAVYEARHEVTGRRVAVKLLRSEIGFSALAVERFIREAKIAAAIGHKNIVEVFDAGADAERGIPFMVLELLQGKSLADEVHERGTLPVGEVLTIATELCDALIAAHKAGVIHRDIKPENVFLCEQEGKRTGLKLLDFGISKVTGSEVLEARSLTKTGGIVGTVTYMSPEQVRGDPVDARTDVWAMGVLLFRLLSGQLPFDGKNSNVVMIGIATRPAPSLASVAPTLPSALCAIVDRTLQSDREQRTASIQALAEELRALPAIASDLRVDPSQTPQANTQDPASANKHSAEAFAPTQTSASLQAVSKESIAASAETPRKSWWLAIVAAGAVASLVFVGVSLRRTTPAPPIASTAIVHIEQRNDNPAPPTRSNETPAIMGTTPAIVPDAEVNIVTVHSPPPPVNEGRNRPASVRPPRASVAPRPAPVSAPATPVVVAPNTGHRPETQLE